MDSSRKKTFKRFFIAGCQRSGTTLTRLVLECHPQIICYDELSSYDRLKSRESDPETATRIGFKIPMWTELIGRSGSDGVPDFYRGEPILVLLRDPLDTVASMMALRLGEQSWMEAWGLPILKEKIATDSAFRDRYSREIQILRDVNESLPAAGGLYWLFKTDAGFDLLSQGYPVTMLPYEHLVHEPRHTLGKALEAIEVSWDDSVLNHPSLPHGEMVYQGLTVGLCDPKRAIDTSSVERGKQFFSREDAELIRRMTASVDPRYHVRGGRRAAG